VANSGLGDYNCVWSPDQTKIAYVQGVFSTGALVMKNANGTGGVSTVVDDVVGRFDGNPDWAPDPPPTCTDVGPVDVAHNGSVPIQLTCTDPENQPLTYSIVTQPSKGTLSNLNTATGTVTYTANQGASGPDSFAFKANDGKSDSNTATVTLSIAAAPAGGGGGGGGGGTEPVVEPLPLVPSNRFIRGRSIRARDGSIVLRFVLESRGVMEVADTSSGRKARVKRTRKRGGPGSLLIRLRPSSSGKKLLAEGDRVRTRIQMTFTPVGGTEASRTTRIALFRR
ncbi:MAG TPA: Ig-like domain-containing protein, partial [Solirubrobacteraceae bacterium]|nr:Ig-like domain-containing protein [Solirubrobacteraceae bacterium]